MWLVIVILILLVWGVIKIIEDYKYPELPHIEDTEEHLKKVQSIPTQKGRQKYIRDLGHGKITEKDDVSKYRNIR